MAAVGAFFPPATTAKPFRSRVPRMGLPAMRDQREAGIGGSGVLELADAFSVSPAANGFASAGAKCIFGSRSQPC